MRLDAKDVNISISGKPIVQHLSIEVPDRKFSALLGANGSGKTTLLRSIYRTQKMDSGIVRLDDEDITHFPGKKLARNMAVMGQFNQINFDYTVLDIALMGRYPFHSLLEQERERDYEIALEALDKVGMKNYRDRNFQSLSGGEKQRVVGPRADPVAQDPDPRRTDKSSGYPLSVRNPFNHQRFADHGPGSAARSEPCSTILRPPLSDETRRNCNAGPASSGDNPRKSAPNL